MTEKKIVCFVEDCREELKEITSKIISGISADRYYQCKKGHKFWKHEEIGEKPRWHCEICTKYEWLELESCLKINWNRVPKE